MATQISSLQPAVGITTNPFGGEAGASSDFWNLYIKGRPHLQESLLQRVWSYHTSKGGKFEVVHEPGAGVGVHSRRFAAKFSQIIIFILLFGSDEDQIKLARGRLERNFEILTKLQTYWSTLDSCLVRFQEFHKACIKSKESSFKLDRWMLQFLFEFANPIGERTDELAELHPWSMADMGFSPYGGMPS